MCIRDSDITGPGAKEAFEKVYLPNMARLAGHPSLQLSLIHI